jgi:hypothetical protein
MMGAMRAIWTILLGVAALSQAGCEGQTAQPSPDKPAPAATVKPTAEETAAKSDAVPTATPSDTAKDVSPPPSGGTAVASAPPTPNASATGSAQAKDEEVVGEKKNEGEYSAWLQGGSKYAVGKPGSVQAVLVAKGEYHCNPEYPYKVKLDAPPEGVSYPDPIARSVSIGNERTTLSIPFTPSSAGPKTIRGTFFFSVCNASQCKIQKQPMSVTVNVAEGG